MDFSEFLERYGDFAVGRGGAGQNGDGSWPPGDGKGCPFCGCFGVSGHGGGCPNMHLIFGAAGEVTGRRHPEDPYAS